MGTKMVILRPGSEELEAAKTSGVGVTSTVCAETDVRETDARERPTRTKEYIIIIMTV